MKILRGCLSAVVVVFLALGIFIVSILFLITLGVRNVRAMDPKAFSQEASTLIERGAWPLPEVLKLLGFVDERAQELAPPVESAIGEDLLNRAAYAEFRLDEKKGAGSGDRFLYLALTQGESGKGCGGAGGGYVVEELRKRFDPATTERQIEWLERFALEWQKRKIRDSNPIAARYITPDYDYHKVEGSRLGGAIGCSQFLPGTAGIHWEELAVCDYDLWDPDCALMAMSLELYRLGYRPALPYESKVKILLGWNADPPWIEKIVSQSEEYRRRLGKEESFATLLLVRLGLVRSQEETEARKGETGVFGAGKLPSLASTSAVTLDLSREVPQNDGEKENVIIWAKSNARFLIQPGQVWDFCTQTNLTGWGKYRIAAGVAAGGICFNASLLQELAQADKRLEIVSWSRHAWKGFPRLHTVVWCPGTPLTIRNVSKEPLSIVWALSGSQISVGVESFSEKGVR